MKRMDEQPRLKLSRAGYPYAYARISARKGRLIPRSEYRKLLKMELNGITRYLEESSYKEAIDALVAQHSGVELIERAIDRDMVRTAAALRRILPAEVRTLMEAFLGRWDVQNVKTALRGLAAGISKERMAALFVPAGALDEGRLLKLLDEESPAAALKRAALPGTKEALAALQENDLVAAENALDRAYFDGCLALAARASSEGRPFTRFLEEEIDTVNIRTLLRLKRHGLAAARIMPHLILGGAAFDERRLRRLAAADSVETLLDLLRHTRYRAAFDAPTEDLVGLELALERLLVRRSFLFTRQQPLTVMSLMSYLFAKVVEMRNLKTLVKAKQLGLEDEFIERKMVVA